MNAYNTYKPTDGETDYVRKMLNIEPNDISYIFFSNNNINYLNNALIEEIKQLTFMRYGQKIGIMPQKKHMMYTIMRHIYFKNIRNTFDAQTEVDMLNKELLRQTVPIVMRELIAYMRYINDYNSIVPLPLPQSDGRKQDNTGAFSRMFGF